MKGMHPPLPCILVLSLQSPGVVTDAPLLKKKKKRVPMMETSQVIPATFNPGLLKATKLTTTMVGAMSGNWRKWHRAAEKEEESSKEDSELVATTQHRAAASDEAGTNWDNDAHPGVGFVKTNVARAENDSHSEEEWWGHAPAPLPSETPTSFLAGHSSPNVDFESEGGVASPAIGTMEKVIDLWNDREALSRAHMKLVDKLSR
ncbi:hypothetical protein EI94DRAFT_1709293, partial [Lactarius quietus]